MLHRNSSSGLDGSLVGFLTMAVARRASAPMVEKRDGFGERMPCDSPMRGTGSLL